MGCQCWHQLVKECGFVSSTSLILFWDIEEAKHNAGHRWPGEWSWVWKFWWGFHKRLWVQSWLQAHETPWSGHSRPTWSQFWSLGGWWLWPECIYTLSSCSGDSVLNATLFRHGTFNGWLCQEGSTLVNGFRCCLGNRFVILDMNKFSPILSLPSHHSFLLGEQQRALRRYGH